MKSTPTRDHIDELEKLISDFSVDICEAADSHIESMFALPEMKKVEKRYKAKLERHITQQVEAGKAQELEELIAWAEENELELEARNLDGSPNIPLATTILPRRIEMLKRKETTPKDRALQTTSEEKSK